MQIIVDLRMQYAVYHWPYYYKKCSVA